MKVKAGDYVRIKKFKKRPYYWNSSGKMDYLMGKTVKVIYASKDGNVTIEGLWCIRKEDYEPINETIVIYRKGNETIAIDKRTGKKAVAKCSPEDAFNFETGAKLAFDRLTALPLFYPKEDKKPLNAKIVFTKGDDTFKTGHIYEIKDGYLEDPRNGEKLPGFKGYEKFYSIEEVKDYFTCREKRKLHGGGWSNTTLEFIEVLND